MDKSLIIVESPSKSKTINKYLGKGFIVEATVGHIKNLPKSKIGVLIDDGYQPIYETIKGKAEVIRRLKNLARGVKKVYIGTDPDREGEAIAWHIAQEIEPDNKSILRVLFHEITKSGITEAMHHPHKIDTKLVDSQQARRVMDRIVGYKISPFVWKTVFYGLSAGRVQSVALRLICEREAEIGKFNPQEYWSITGEFKGERTDSFFAKLFKINDEEPTIHNERVAQEFVRDIQGKSFVVADIQRKQVKRNPAPPFITSSLQQEASTRLRFSTKKTMMLAQRLYDGIELGPEGRVGLITYMRTDSTRLSKEAIAAVREYIYSTYGGDYLPHDPRHFKKRKSSQDAHEAIRPTSVKYAPKTIKKFLDKDLYSLYELIWSRFVACQMKAAEFEQVSVDVRGEEYLFRASSTSPRFRGFLQVYDDIIDQNGKAEDEDPTSRLPENLSSGDSLQLLELLPRQHFTKPPARYTESSLVRELESCGIGRPSTYAHIVSTIQERGYVKQENRALHATALGMDVNKILVENFPNIFNVKFTKKMEEELDTIASGKRSYKRVLNDFYKPFMQSLKKVEKNTQDIKKSLQETTNHNCELCGKPMIIKWGRNGRFVACSGYPDCRNTKPLDEDQEKHQHMAGMKCELCGGDMVVKGGRFGTFLGCSNYPKCTNTKSITTGIKCPKCSQGDLVSRRTKRKRIFYGCSRYPECDFASWDKPVKKSCLNCSYAFLVEKFSDKKGAYLKCPECKEEYLDEEVAAVDKQV